MENYKSLAKENSRIKAELSSFNKDVGNFSDSGGSKQDYQSKKPRISTTAKNTNMEFDDIFSVSFNKFDKRTDRMLSTAASEKEVNAINRDPPTSTHIKTRSNNSLTRN